MADVELFPSSNTLKQGLYFIADFKSLTFLPPFLAQNDEEAKRSFINVLNYSNSIPCRFPEDFKLYKISDYLIAFTGSYDVAKNDMQDYVHSHFTFIASGENCIQKDTSKYDALVEKVEQALKNVSNSNNVLNDQIGNVPNLQKELNLHTSQLQSLRDDFDQYKTEHLVNDDEVNSAFNQSLELLTTNLQNLRDDFEHFKNDDVCIDPEEHKQNFFKRIFS